MKGKSLSNGIARKKMTEDSGRSDSLMFGLTLPVSSMEGIRSCRMATSILLFPELVSFTDFYILALHASKHFGNSYADYDHQQETIFYPMRIPSSLRDALISACPKLKGEAFSRFLRKRFAACADREEGYRILVYAWTVKLVSAIMASEMTPGERSRLLHEDAFPGPGEFYSDLRKLLADPFAVQSGRIDVPVLNHVCADLTAYHRVNTLRSRYASMPKYVAYTPAKLQEVLGVFSCFLDTFPVLLGDPALSHQSASGEMSPLWWNARVWGGEILASLSYTAVAASSPSGFRVSGDPLFASIVSRALADLLSSIAGKKFGSS